MGLDFIDVHEILLWDYQIFSNSVTSMVYRQIRVQKTKILNKCMVGVRSLYVRNSNIRIVLYFYRIFIV